MFHFVRDQVLFQFSRFNDTASETLTSKLPAHLLVGEPSEPCAALYHPERLPDPTPEHTLRTLNRRLAAIRAEMEARAR